MPRSAAIDSLPAAFEMMKSMQDEGLGWGEDCRPQARRAMASIIEDSLAASVDAHLLRVAERGEADRRNGTYRRRILTELGDIELSVPRTRTYSPVAVVRAYPVIMSLIVGVPRLPDSLRSRRQSTAFNLEMVSVRLRVRSLRRG